MSKARWWHTHNPSANLTKASLGRFFFNALKLGVKIGSVWVFNPSFRGSLIEISVWMDDEQKEAMEKASEVRFRLPPKIKVGGQEIVYDEPDTPDFKRVDDPSLKHKGARWFQTEDHHTPSLSQAALGDFFFNLLSRNVQLGFVETFKGKWDTKTLVYVSAFMTDETKASFEASSKYRFRLPPVALQEEW